MTDKHSIDDAFEQLLQETRIALPGVQVLFGFLLTAPFQQGFDQRLDAGDRRVFYATVISLAVATVLLIAPTAHHRMRFPDGAKDRLLVISSNLVLVGTAFLTASIAGSVYVVTAAVYGSGPAAAVAAIVAALTAFVWFVAPLLYGRRPGKTGDDGAPTPKGRRSEISS